MWLVDPVTPIEIDLGDGLVVDFSPQAQEAAAEFKRACADGDLAAILGVEPDDWVPAYGIGHGPTEVGPDVVSG